MATFKINMAAGPLWSNDEAQKKGPFIAAAHQGKFTGQWTTVVENKMSVVQIELDADGRKGDNEFTSDVIAGPIWNNEDAKEKCPYICASYGGTWNGQWKTIKEGVMSVCGCTWKY